MCRLIGNKGNVISEVRPQGDERSVEQVRACFYRVNAPQRACTHKSSKASNLRMHAMKYSTHRMCVKELRLIADSRARAEEVKS